MNEAVKQKILSLLADHRIMTLATLRADGWPQATTVGYVSDGLTLYFLCGIGSQKDANISRDNRVSLTIDHDTYQIMEITGLSMAASATAVTGSMPCPLRVMRIILPAVHIVRFRIAGRGGAG